MKLTTSFLVCCSSLCLILPRELAAEVVFVADPELNAVYYRDTADGPGLPTLLSATTAVQSDHFTYLSSTEALVVPVGENHIVDYDLTSGVVEQVYAPPTGQTIEAIAGGPGANEAAALLYDVSIRTAYVMEGTRTSAGNPWTWTTKATVPATSGTISHDHFDVLKLATDRFVIVLAGPDPKGVILLDTTVPSVPAPIQTAIHQERLRRGPTGSFIVDPTDSDNSQPVRLYDVAGTLLGSVARTNPGTFLTRPSAVVWNGTLPNLVSVSRLGLETGSDPLTPPISSTVVYSFYDGGVPSSEHDFSGAKGLFVSGDQWSLNDSNMGRTVQVDTATDTYSSVHVMQMGAGPAFQDILDIATGPDGSLYVLDRLPSGVRIVGVDRTSGDRTTIAEVSRPDYMPRLEVLSNGDFLLGREHRRDWAGLTPVGQQYSVVLEQVTPGSPSPTITEWPAAPHLPPTLDWKLAGSDEAIVFPEQSLYPSSFLVTSSAASEVSYEEATSTDFTNVSSQTYEAVISVPGFATATRDICFYHRNAGSDFARIVSVTAPDSTVYPTDQSEVFHVAADGSNLVKMASTTVRLATASNLAGNWTVTIKVGGTPAPVRTGIVPLYAAGALNFGVDVGGDLWLAQSSPAVLLRRAPNSEAILQAVTLNTSSSLDLDHLGDLQSSQNAGRMYAAIGDSASVASINLSTGLVSPFITGKPSAVDTALIGASGGLGLSLAVGEIPAPSSAREVYWDSY